MVISTSAFSTPVGSIKSWIRRDFTIDLPFGWLICDGSTVVDSESPFNGKPLPDLRGEFPRGHTTLSNANFAADALYFAGGTVPTGGSDTGAVGHSHPIPNHNHTFNITTNNSAGTQNPANFNSTHAQGVHNHNFSGNTSSFSGTSGSALSSIDNKPTFVETVTIIKVK